MTLAWDARYALFGIDHSIKAFLQIVVSAAYHTGKVRLSFKNIALSSTHLQCNPRWEDVQTFPFETFFRWHKMTGFSFYDDERTDITNAAGAAAKDVLLPRFPEKTFSWQPALNWPTFQEAAWSGPHRNAEVWKKESGWPTDWPCQWESPDQQYRGLHKVIIGIYHPHDLPTQSHLPTDKLGWGSFLILTMRSTLHFIYDWFQDVRF